MSFAARLRNWSLWALAVLWAILSAILYELSEHAIYSAVLDWLKDRYAEETGRILAYASAHLLPVVAAAIICIVIYFLGAFPSEELSAVVSETPQVISAIQCHHYGGDEVRKGAIDTCFRLLERGGLYVTFENIRPDTVRGVEIGLNRWSHFQIEAGRSEQVVKEHRSRFGKNYFPITIADHLELLRVTGFSVVEVFWLSHMQAGFYAIK